MPTAGYSGKPLSQKLGLKPGHRVQLLGSPPGFRDALRPWPEQVRFISARAADPDCILLFSASTAGLARSFPPARRRLPAAGMLWVAWPKQAAKVATDLTETVVRRIGLAEGLVDVKVCAIDATWSGLKFVRRLTDR